MCVEENSGEECHPRLRTHTTLLKKGRINFMLWCPSEGLVRGYLILKECFAEYYPDLCLFNVGSRAIA